MLEKNKECIVEIIDNGYQGEGIAKIDNMPIFINGAIKGEKIKIKILKVQKNFAFGKILEIIKKSDVRVEADCNNFIRCGGCDLRHIKYEETLRLKKSIVKNCLYKALKREIEVKDVIGMKEPLNYRNKLQYPVGINVAGDKVMGVYSKRTHNIIPTNDCCIQNKECNKIANDVFKFIKENNISAYNEKNQNGTVRHIIVRIGKKTNEILITLVLNDDNFKKEDQFIQYITNKYNNVKTIAKNYNSKNTNVILGEKTEIIYGPGYIYDILGKYKFKISPQSFYQVNPVQTEVLYNNAIKYVEKNLEEIALDLYCGIGTIGIFASNNFKKVYGIEIVPQAIENAIENAKINKIENIKFYSGDVEQILPEIMEKEKIKPNVVFVDPPRKGLDNNTIGLLKNVQPKKIIYISCNPATLVRDLSLLEEKYEIKEIQPVDMFPYTSHVECVSLLCRK